MFRFTDLIIFRMTKACNMDCKYCFMKDRPENKPQNYIEQEMLERIIDQIIAHRIINNRDQFLLNLVLHGGEVMVLGVERLEKILDYIKQEMEKYCITYQLSTQSNASLLTTEIAQLLSKHDVSVGMSFDGVDGANGDRTSGKQSIIEEKFKILQDNDVKYGLIMVASKNTLDKQRQSQEYVESLPGISSYKTLYAEDMDTPGADSPIEIEGSEFFEKVYKPILDDFIDNGKVIKEDELNGMIKDAFTDILTEHDKVKITGCGGKSCGSALHMIAIEPDGQMDICDRFSRHFDDPEVNMMHALDYDFLAIHQIQKALKFHSNNNKVILDTGCDHCPADYMCKHGCMAFHYSKFDQKWGLDKYLVCGIYKNLFNYIEKNTLALIKRMIGDNVQGEVCLAAQSQVSRVKPEIEQWLKDNSIKIKINSNRDDKNNYTSYSIQMSYIY